MLVTLELLLRPRIIELGLVRLLAPEFAKQHFPVRRRECRLQTLRRPYPRLQRRRLSGRLCFAMSSADRPASIAAIIRLAASNALGILSLYLPSLRRGGINQPIWGKLKAVSGLLRRNPVTMTLRRSPLSVS